MTNTSYCRFHNTLADLTDCYEHLDDGDELSLEEELAQLRLIRLCVWIVERCGDAVGCFDDGGGFMGVDEYKFKRSVKLIKERHA